ncbi:hypothetical protein JCM6882_002662 [Rhodosporidiobolus microsporus]
MASSSLGRRRPGRRHIYRADSSDSSDSNLLDLSSEEEPIAATVSNPSSSSSEYDLEVPSNRLKVKWKVGEWDEILKEKKNRGVNVVLSPPFDSGRWQLQLEFLLAGKGSKPFVGAYLRALPMEAETRSDGSWARDDIVSFTLIINGRMSLTLATSSRFTQYKWTSKKPAFGSPHLIEQSKLQHQAPVTVIAFIKQSYHIFDAPPKAVDSPLLDICRGLFEDPSASDVVFCFPHGNLGAGKELRSLIATKAILSRRLSYFQTMFEAGFAEGGSIGEDENEDAAPAAKRRKVDKGKGAEPAKDNDPWLNDDDSIEWLPHSFLPKPGSVDALSVLEKDGAVDGKGRTVVNVLDAGYTTYRAMLYYLYTGHIAFTPPASNFTVAITAGEKTEGLGSRRNYLLNQSSNKVHAGPVELASPHAVYCLADKLGLDKLKDEAKKAILAGFTADNILYELVSTLSAQHDEIQQAARKFTLDHWASSSPSVQGSTEGQVEGAGEILKELLLGLKA